MSKGSSRLRIVHGGQVHQVIEALLRARREQDLGQYRTIHHQIVLPKVRDRLGDARSKASLEAVHHFGLPGQGRRRTWLGGGCWFWRGSGVAAAEFSAD